MHDASTVLHICKQATHSHMQTHTCKHTHACTQEFIDAYNAKYDIAYKAAILRGESEEEAKEEANGKAHADVSVAAGKTLYSKLFKPPADQVMVSGHTQQQQGWTAGQHQQAAPRR